MTSSGSAPLTQARLGPRHHLDLSAFVGREREFALLRRAVEEVLAGRGRVVLVAGEAGIGKTRTAQELAAYAPERGMQVLWGRYEGALAYSEVGRTDDARHEVQTLSDSFEFFFRGQGHAQIYGHYDATRAPCAIRLMAEFLEDPTRAPDGSCVAALPPPHFLGT